MVSLDIAFLFLIIGAGEAGLVEYVMTPASAAAIDNDDFFATSAIPPIPLGMNYRKRFHEDSMLCTDEHLTLTTYATALICQRK